VLNRTVPLSWEQFWGAIAEPMGMNRTDVELPTTLRGDLGLDSLDMLEVFMIMEDLDCTVAEDEMALLESVGDLYEHYRLRAGSVTQ
jgi:acyl carrier protein